jgi:CRP-like cAMP-binding protein
MIDKNILKKVQIFNGLTESQLETISNFLAEEEIQKGHYIIKENTTGEKIYILCRGIVTITRKLTLDIGNIKNEEKKLATLSDKIQPLPSFGENAIVEAGIRTANVIAKTNCVMYSMTKDQFKEIENHDISISYIIMKNIATTIANRLKKTDENVIKLATALSIAVAQN